MKSFLNLLFAFLISYSSFAQSFSSNQFKVFNWNYERIDIQNLEGETTISVAPKFYRHEGIKETIKPLKVKGQTYFIKKRKIGSQSVYTKSGEHVADILRHNYSIRMINEGQTYFLQPRINNANFNTLKCKNSEGDLIAKLALNNDRKLAVNFVDEQNTNHLLIALCVSEYQELLLGDRGLLSL